MDNSGNAFPFQQQHEGYSDWGLTKREYIAAMVMQGILSNRQVSSVNNGYYNLSAECVTIADHLLGALK